VAASIPTCTRWKTRKWQPRFWIWTSNGHEPAAAHARTRFHDMLSCLLDRFLCFWNTALICCLDDWEIEQSGHDFVRLGGGLAWRRDTGEILLWISTPDCDRGKSDGYQLRLSSVYSLVNRCSLLQDKDQQEEGGKVFRRASNSDLVEQRSSGEHRRGELTDESCLQAPTSARNGGERRKRGAHQDQSNTS
jgi:hypothetical protein